MFASSGRLWLAELLFLAVAGNSLAGAQIPIWREQFGTAQDDQARAVVPDGSGGAFVGATTNNGVQSYLARIDAAGNLAWLRKILPIDGQGGYVGTMECGASDGSGGLILAGRTPSSLFGTTHGGEDVWLTRHDSLGVLLWGSQFGTSGDDRVSQVEVDASGRTFACGSGGATEVDAWVTRLNAQGQPQWIRFVESTDSDYAYGCAPDSAGGVFVAGHTY